MGWTRQELSKGTCREDFPGYGAASVMIPSFTCLRDYSDSLSHLSSSSVAGKTWYIEVLLRKASS